MTKLRRDHPVFRRRRWFHGRRIRAIEDLAWFRPDGEAMTDEDWEDGNARAIGVFLNGEAIPTTDAYGGRIVDDSFFVMISADHEPLDVDGAPGDPAPRLGRRARHRPAARARARRRPSATLDLVDRSVLVLRSPAAVTP